MTIGIMGTRGIPNRYGGFEQFAAMLSAGLVRKGHTVSVYTPHTHPYGQREWNGVQLIRCKEPAKLGTAGQFFYDRNCLLDAKQRRFDILLHLGYTSDSIWHRRWPASSVNIVNMDGLEWKRSKYNRITRLFLKKAEALAARHADLLIADSPGIRQHILNFYRMEAEYIPYAAEIFSGADPSLLKPLQLEPYGYLLLIARMEPENNIETVIQGWLQSGNALPLVIVGSTANAYGRRLKRKYQQAGIRFTEAIYDPFLLNNLRHFSHLYFHGHSVGGTNPSLLEAMACSCTIAAHDNIFNKAILQEEGYYFADAAGVAHAITYPPGENKRRQWQEINRERIVSSFNPELIISRYEQVMKKALAQRG